MVANRRGATPTAPTLGVPAGTGRIGPTVPRAVLGVIVAIVAAIAVAAQLDLPTEVVVAVSVTFTLGPATGLFLIAREHHGGEGKGKREGAVST